MTNTLPVVGGLSFLTIVIGGVLWAKWKVSERLKSRPTSWSHIGEAPKGVETALRVIKEQLPGWLGPYGGVIEWVKEPWMQTDPVKGQIRSAGTVLNYEPVRLRVLYFEDVSQCALAHEIFHVYQDRIDSKVDYDSDPALQPWVAETNAKIRAAMA